MGERPEACDNADKRVDHGGLQGTGAPVAKHGPDNSRLGEPVTGEQASKARGEIPNQLRGAGSAPTWQ